MTDEQQLIQRMLAGDEQAFEAFFNSYFARVYRFALPSRFTGTPAVHTSLASGSARTTVAVDGTDVKVEVTRRGAGSARILMVSASYYTR